MITRLKIENFKSIGSPGVDVELKPLTILVGPNGSGKSNILQALAILSAKAGSQFNTIRTEDLPVLRTSELLDLVHKRSPRKWLTFTIHIKPDKEEVKRLTPYREDAEKSTADVSIPPIRTVGYSFSWKNEREQCRQTVLINGQKIMSTARLYESKKRKIVDVYEYPKESQGLIQHSSSLHLLQPVVFSVKSRTAVDDLAGLVQEIVTTIASRVGEKVFLISALRGHIPYSPESGQPPRWVGIGGEYVVHILSLLGRRKYKEKKERVTKWASRFGLVDVSGTWSRRNILMSDYADPELDTALNTALASHGSKQILSIIVQLFWSEPNDLIMIEEPEISLHPNAQALLPHMFAEALNEGKQIMITTHSEFLMLAMSDPVRKGFIKPKDIAVYHVDKDSTGTHVKPLDVTSEGFIKGWVPSFAEIEQKLLKEWLQTMPEDE